MSGAGVGGAAKASRSAFASGPRRITFDRSIVRLRGLRGGFDDPQERAEIAGTDGDVHLGERLADRDAEGGGVGESLVRIGGQGTIEQPLDCRRHVGEQRPH